MTTTPSAEVFDPANRPSEAITINSASRFPNKKESSMSTWKEEALSTIAKTKNSDNETTKETNGYNDIKNEDLEKNLNSGSSLNSPGSSGSLGEPLTNHDKRESSQDHSYFSVDTNLPLEVINPILDLVDDDDLGMPLSQQDEKLLEELLRLKLTSAPEATAASLLPPKQRIKLFQPRTKLEQFEDILIESQLLEASLTGGTPNFAEIMSASDSFITGSNQDSISLPGLPLGPGGYPGIGLESIDFDTSDVIFGDSNLSEEKKHTGQCKIQDECPGTSENNPERVPPSEKGDSFSIGKLNITDEKSIDIHQESIEKINSKYNSNSSKDQILQECDCSSCNDRASMESNRIKEIEKLRNAWIDVREQVWKVYHLVISNSWNDAPGKERPDLFKIKKNVCDLCSRDPHQLYQRLEALVRELVLEMKLRLIELLQRQAKNPSLAQDFIENLLEGYQKLCDAAQKVSPALLDLEEKHLGRFALTWEDFNKHLYQSVIYTDPLIQNNLPIFISQLRSLYPDKEHEAKYTELVREYLDFDVEMENIGAFWRHSESQITNYIKEQNILKAKQKMLKEDWEKFKAQRNEVKRKFLENKPTQEVIENFAPSEGEPMIELGKSLNKLLTGLEDLGIDATIPHDMEMDLKHAMDLIDIGDAASSLNAASPFSNMINPKLMPLSLEMKRKNLSLAKLYKDEIDAGEEADDDLTEEFLSRNSSYRNLLNEGRDKQVAQFLQEGVFKSGSKHAFQPNEDDGEDTDADVDDVIDEEEINNFVDFLQFATSTEFQDNIEIGAEHGKDLFPFAAFASARDALNESSSFVTLPNLNALHFSENIYPKDDAFLKLPAKLSLQDPKLDDEISFPTDKVSDIERLFLSTPTFMCQNPGKYMPFKHDESSLSKTTCYKHDNGTTDCDCDACYSVNVNPVSNCTSDLSGIVSKLKESENIEENLTSEFNNINISAKSKMCDGNFDEANDDSGLPENIILPNSSPESIAKLYPHLYSTILQGQTSLLRENANQSLAALFPSVLTAEGPKCKNELTQSLPSSLPGDIGTVNSTPSANMTGSVAVELSQALSTALSLSTSETSKGNKTTEIVTNSMPRSETIVTHVNSIETKNNIQNSAKANVADFPLKTDHFTNSTCSSAKKRKHQPPISTSSASTTIHNHSTNVTSPLRSLSESTSSSGKEMSKHEIGPVTLGDALQQKIRETQAKIRSNVISASNSQSILPPGKCNSQHNHQTGSKELNQLLHQHYCGKKAPKAPSASAIRKGKVPPPPRGSSGSPSSSQLVSGEGKNQVDNRDLDSHPEDCDSCCTTDEMTDEDEDDVDDFDEDESSQASTSTNATTTDQGATTSSSSSKHSHNHPNAHHHPCGNKVTCEQKGDKDHSGDPGKGHCLCCYCEAFGRGGASTAPMSKNYPEMRERLRLLLSKKNKGKHQSQCGRKCQKENGTQHEQPKVVSSSKSSNTSSTSSIGTRSIQVDIKAQLSGSQIGNKMQPESAIMNSKSEKNIEAQRHPKFRTRTISVNGVPVLQPKKAVDKLSDSTPLHKENDGYSNSKNSVISQAEHVNNLNQKDASRKGKPASSESMPKSEDNQLMEENDDYIIAEEVSKIKDVDELLNYIEGNQRAVANDKKKAKKERQKQQKIEELRKREEAEKRIREEQEKEKHKLEQEKKRREEEERLRLKKMNKKAAQKAKKQAAKGIVGSNSTELNGDGDIDIASGAQISNQSNSENYDQIQTLEQLKAQHMKELQELQLLHRQQLEEEHQKLLKKQSEQVSLIGQQNQDVKFDQLNKKERKKGKNNAKVAGTITKEHGTSNSSNSVQASAYKTLAEAAKNPGNQIKITRMPNGGVEFSTVPAAHEQISTKYIPNSSSATMEQKSAPPPYLQDMFSSNSGIQPQNHYPAAAQNYHPPNPNQTRENDKNDRPCVPSLSNQPMFTIRRVENPTSRDPTVTISMKDSTGGPKNPRPHPEPSKMEQDKLLYTIVNGKIQKSSDAPENLLPQATSMSTNIRPFPQKISNNASRQPENGTNDSFGGTNPKSARAPLPLDSSGKVDLRRLELPSGISITKIDGQAPERKYFPSKPSDHQEQNILPLPGQHEAQRNLFTNFSPTGSNGTNSRHSAENLGPYNIPGIGPTNPNNVIVVDTSSLVDNSSTPKLTTSHTGEKAGKKGKKKSKANQAQLQATTTNSSSALQYKNQSNNPYVQQGRTNYSPPSCNQSNGTEIKNTVNSSNGSTAGGDLKAGPQVLIKNINGRVVITPVPETGSRAQDQASKSVRAEQNDKLDNQSKSPFTKLDNTKINHLNNESSISYNWNTQPSLPPGFSAQKDIASNSTVSIIAPNNQNLKSFANQETDRSTLDGIDLAYRSQNVRNENLAISDMKLPALGEDNKADLLSNQIHNKLSKSVNDVENVGGRRRYKKHSIGDNFEDLNSVFAPKDIDLDNGEIDDDEREIEAFKRFCFNSVPLQEKPKVNFDMKNISLKKK